MRYRVTFINDKHESLKSVSVLAATPTQAMIIAENMSDLYRWNINYTDMIAEAQK